MVNTNRTSRLKEKEGYWNINNSDSDDDENDSNITSSSSSSSNNNNNNINTTTASSSSISPEDYPAPEEYFVSVESIQRLWLGKTIGRTLIAPLDRVKFILQCQRELRRLGTLQHDFRGAWHCVQHLYRAEGCRSFWRGNLIQVISLLPIMIAQLFIALPTQALVFQLCGPSHSALSYTCVSYGALLSGALAAATVSYPLEYARFRLAVDLRPLHSSMNLNSTSNSSHSHSNSSNLHSTHLHHSHYEYRHSLDFFSHPAFTETPRLLYTGLGLYVVGSLLYQSVHDGMLSLFGAYIPPETPTSGLGTIAAQVSTGLTISALSTLCLHPVDTVRRRMMIAATEEDLRYNSSVNCLKYILRTEGPAGLYRGAGFTLLRMMGTTALFTLGGIPT